MSNIVSSSRRRRISPCPQPTPSCVIHDPCWTARCMTPGRRQAHTGFSQALTNPDVITFMAIRVAGTVAQVDSKIVASYQAPTTSLCNSSELEQVQGAGHPSVLFGSIVGKTTVVRRSLEEWLLKTVVEGSGMMPLLLRTPPIARVQVCPPEQLKCHAIGHAERALIRRDTSRRRRMALSEERQGKCEHDIVVGHGAKIAKTRETWHARTGKAARNSMPIVDLKQTW